jgi:uncharacterized protein (DUF433 family)/DNA-binding transcriptional MerR regulator
VSSVRKREFGDELVGWYLAHEVGQLAGVTGDQIGQWARRGYIRSSRNSGSPRVYTFQDVAEAILVHLLIEQGVPRQTVRGTIEALRTTCGDWPLQNAELLLAGEGDKLGRGLHYRSGRVLLDASKKADQIVAEDVAGQLVEVVDLLSRGGWAAQSLPDVTSIEVDPRRMSGRPAIRGRRISVEDVVVMMNEEDDGRKLLKVDYGLSDKQIDDALAWWAASNQFGLAA